MASKKVQEQDAAQLKIEERDKEKRLSEEARVMKLAEALTNGHAGCPKTTGSVIHWMVTELISQGEILRTLAPMIPNLQAKSDCALLHGKLVGQITLLGMTYKVPLTTLIICSLIYCLVKF